MAGEYGGPRQEKRSSVRPVGDPGRLLRRSFAHPLPARAEAPRPGQDDTPSAPVRLAPMNTKAAEELAGGLRDHAGAQRGTTPAHGRPAHPGTGLRRVDGGGDRPRSVHRPHRADRRRTRRRGPQSPDGGEPHGTHSGGAERRHPGFPPSDSGPRRRPRPADPRVHQHSGPAAPRDGGRQRRRHHARRGRDRVGARGRRGDDLQDRCRQRRLPHRRPGRARRTPSTSGCSGARCWSASAATTRNSSAPRTGS